MAGAHQPPPPSEELHLPGPSYQPVLVAVGTAIALVGVIISWVIVVIGVAILLVSTVRWVRQARVEMGELPLVHRH